MLDHDRRNKIVDKIKKVLPSISNLFDDINIALGFISDADIIKTAMLISDYQKTGHTDQLNKWIKELKEIQAISCSDEAIELLNQGIMTTR